MNTDPSERNARLSDRIGQSHGISRAYGLGQEGLWAVNAFWRDDVSVKIINEHEISANRSASMFDLNIRTLYRHYYMKSRQDQSYYWWLTGSCVRAIDWYQNQWPWMTLNGHFALCHKIHAFSEPNTKISMKIDPHHQRQRCSAMTVCEYADIRGGFFGNEASNDSGGGPSGVIENVYFRRFRTLRLRHLKKWG